MLSSYQTKQLQTLQKQIDDLQKKVNKYKAQLLQEMQDAGVEVFEDNNIKVKLVYGHYRDKIDNEKLKAIYRNIYDDCITQSYVKESLRLEIK